MRGVSTQGAGARADLDMDWLRSVNDDAQVTFGCAVPLVQRVRWVNAMQQLLTQWAHRRLATSRPRFALIYLNNIELSMQLELIARMTSGRRFGALSIELAI